MNGSRKPTPHCSPQRPQCIVSGPRSVFLFPALLILSFLFASPLPANERDVLHHDELVVFFDHPLQAVAREVTEAYPALKRELEKDLSWKVTFRPTVLLLKNNDTFPETVVPDLTVAFASPRRNLIVIDCSKMNLHPFTLETTLKHELCHLLLHQSIPQGNLPRWLDEGVCRWVSDGAAEIIMDGRQSVLNEMVLTGRYIPLKALAERFPREEAALIAAYEQSKSFVKYIHDRFGRDRFLQILDSLREGVEVEAAVRNSLSLSFEELEQEWHEHLRRRMTWFAYVSLHLYEILFFLAALITFVYGFIRLVVRKRAYREEEEEGTDDFG